MDEDLRTPPETWSNAELRGVSINPVVIGIGRHPCSVSDEDWVLGCERDVEENGLAQFLTDLLHVLRLTIPKYLGEPQPVGEYPKQRSEGEVPLPNVSCRGDRDWNDDGWNKEMVGGILCNPVFAGIPPFEAAVDEQTWIAAGVKMAGQGRPAAVPRQRAVSVEEVGRRVGGGGVGSSTSPPLPVRIPSTTRPAWQAAVGRGGAGASVGRKAFPTGVPPGSNGRQLAPHWDAGVRRQTLPS